jgi:4-amino-4-deoxy-L-arabinose transferase-like glycosyltransferase
MGQALVVAVLVQIVLAGILAFYVHRIAISVLPRTAALFATLVILLLPDLVRAELTATPDFLVVLCVLLAVYDLFEARPLVAGVWLGASTLFRFHALAYAVAVVLAVAILTREWRATMRVLLGALPFVVVILGVAAWSAPHTAFSGTAFNIWKTIHGGVDWHHPPTGFDRDVIDVITAAPSLFFHSCLLTLRDTWYVWLPFVAFLILSNRKPVAAIVRAVIYAALIYHLLTIPGGSARGPVVVLPFSVLAAIWTLLTLIRIPIESRAVRRMVLALGAGFSAVVIAMLMLASMSSGDRIVNYGELAAAVQIGTAIAPDKVYSDDYALYFPSAGGATPRFSGGWPEMGLPSYAARYPHLPDSTPDAFYNALSRGHIKAIAIRGRPLNARAFAIVNSDSVHYPSRHMIGGYHVYAVR